jgi:hypothetical protein
MTSKTIDISIAITDLASLCQMDHYNNFSRVVCKLWSQLHPTSYNMYKSQCYKNGDYVANDTMKQKMLVLNNRLSKNINVVKEVANINKLKNNTNELQAKQKELYKKIQKVINEKVDSVKTENEKMIIQKQAEELHRIVKSATNVVYGSKNENNGYKFFEEVTGIEVKSRQKYMKHRVATYDLPSGEKIRWYIKGVADGETVLDEIIEIKNRQKKLFKTVRDYEMCQIQTYLHIAKRDIGYLVEIITDSENNLTGNVIKVAKQDKYLSSVVGDNLNRIIYFLMKLFYLDNTHTMLSDEEKDTILLNLIKGDQDNFVKTFIYS